MFLSALREALIIKKEELSYIKKERLRLNKEDVAPASLYGDISRLTAMTKIISDLEMKISSKANKGKTKLCYENDLLYNSSYKKEIVKFMKSRGYVVETWWQDDANIISICW